ncbi:MAG: sugar porter family MFS transporter [Candidatus Marinimicrobia bacterium]|nr:sugar porter family MFS transporter [Candidatus Neomarinimicrobiota bacterium]
MKKTNFQFNIKYLIAISLVSAMGGFLFGYDWVVIGGAKPFYEKFFTIASDPVLQGWAMSSALLGCLLGSLISGVLSEAIGRKKLLILSALMFTASAIGTGYSESLTEFIIYRILGGIGIGIASNLSPIYIAEISPAKLRGQFVSINQLTIVIGILAAQIVNWQIAEPVATQASPLEILESWNGQMGWRWMFWAETLPAALFLILMFFIPESPRWLLKNGDREKSRTILAKIGDQKYALEEINNISQTLKNMKSKVSFSSLLEPGTRKVLIIGIVLAAFQQWCGINVIFNYAEEVFSSAGYAVTDILFNIVITGSVNLIFTFLALFTVDKIGRKKLMLTGAGGLTVIYFVIGMFYLLNINGWPLLILVVSAIGCYAMTLAPVTWVLLSEIFPNRIRGVAMAIATFSLWLASFLLTYTFPILNNLFQAFGTFWLYGIICIVGFVFILRKLPETMNMTLEDIERKLISEKDDIDA